MPHLPEIVRAFSRLLDYPDERTLESAEFLYVALQKELPEAAGAMSEFGRFAEQRELHELQEAFTATFEINPPCALDIGWHLFGEEYERGQLLVRMREELRRHGIEESPSELPDHITNVLPLIAAMTDDDARRFAQACVLPALTKMQDALDAADSAWSGVVRSLVQLLRYRWPDAAEPAEQQCDEARQSHKTPHGVDLLHAFPVADAPFFDPAEHAANQATLDIVPLQLSFQTSSDAATRPLPTTHHPRPTPER